MRINSILSCNCSRAAYLWLHAIQEVGNCLWEGAGVFWVIYHAQNSCKALLHDRWTPFHFLYQPGNEKLSRTAAAKNFTEKGGGNHLDTSADESVRSLILRIASAAASWTKVLLCFRPTSRNFLHNLTEELSPNPISVTVIESAINWHDAAITRSLRVVVKIISGMWFRCLKICYIIYPWIWLANYKYKISTNHNVHCGDDLPGLKGLSRNRDKHLQFRTMTRVPHECRSCQRIPEDGPVMLFKCFIVPKGRKKYLQISQWLEARVLACQGDK